MTRMRPSWTMRSISSLRFSRVSEPWRDARIGNIIVHGRGKRAILAQLEYDPLPLSVQVALLAVSWLHLDDIAVSDIQAFRKERAARLSRERPNVMASIF